MIKVALADDQTLVRDGLRAILELAGMQVVAEAATGIEALQVVRTQSPDVVLMDIQMPGMDGIEATRRIVRSGASTRGLILTTFDLDRFVYDDGGGRERVPAQGRGAGADYRRGAHRGQRRPACCAGHRATAHRAVHPAHPTRCGCTQQLQTLSGRELEVLRLVARGMSNDEIASHLVIGRATVKTHVSRLLDKLAVSDRVQLVVQAYESGFVAPGER